MSVDAVHESVAWPSPPVAVRFAGVVGATVSSHGAGRRTNEETDGTPVVLTIQSM